MDTGTVSVQCGIFLHPGIYHDGNLQRCQLLPAKRHFRENEPAADEVLRKPDLRRGALQNHQRCGYPAAGAEPEYHAADHFGDNADRCIYHDAEYQRMDDFMCPADPAVLDVHYRQGDEAVPEVFPAAAEISG